jgi:hypothetical protein
MSSSETQKRQLLYDHCMQTNDLLRDSNEKISTRFANMLTLDSSVLTVLFGIAYFLFQNGTAGTTYLPHSLALITSLGVSMSFFFGAIAFGVFYYRPTAFVFPDPSILIDRLKEKTHEEVLAAMAATIAKQVSLNMKTVNNRGSKLKVMMTLTALGFVGVLVTAFVLIYV